jgi:GNAT superfamily N-acetyltransferase
LPLTFLELLLRFVELLNTIDEFLFPDTSIDHTRTDAFTDALSFFEHHFTDLGPHWSLEYLGVLPTAQKCGHGRALVEWGLEQARLNGLPAAVICSAGSEGFYHKSGFNLRIGNVTEGEGNPLAKVDGGEILVWRP